MLLILEGKFGHPSSKLERCKLRRIEEFKWEYDTESTQMDLKDSVICDTFCNYLTSLFIMVLKDLEEIKNVVFSPQYLLATKPSI